MKIVKYLMMVFGLVGVVLSFVYDLPAYGTHGIIVLACCALPVVLAALSFAFTATPRWLSVLSALAFLVAAMKTSSGPSDLQNIMMAAAGGLIAALALAIRPDRRAARAAVAS
jgi:hypothetical protein